MRSTILEISEKMDVGLTEHDKEDIVQMLINCPPEKKTSALLDIEAKRGTKMDFSLTSSLNWVMHYALKVQER